MLIDVHGHPPRSEGDSGAFFDALARWDSRLLISHLGPQGRGYLQDPSFEELTQGNDECAAFVRAHPDVLAGYCYVNPSRTQEALDEMERRLLGQADAFVALKLWVAVRCSDARLDPIMEFCAAHAVPVLQHTWMKVGPTGPGSGNLPGESTPLDLLALARRHPKVKFFGGHTGGDWEWGVAALKQVDNVWLDVAGGEATGAYAEIALAAVGAGRIVYGTDVSGRSVPSQLAKIVCLDVPAADLDRMLWQNAAEVLGDRLPATWGTGRPGVSAVVATTARPVVLTTRPEPVRTPLIDVNSFLGDWPSRRLHASPPTTPAAQLARRLQSMERHGIERAVVSPLDAVFLKDVDIANHELHELLARQPSASRRVTPAYVINPTWPAWAEHLERCRNGYGGRAARGVIRLLPGYHAYRLDDESIRPCLDRLAELELAVIVTVQLEDSRMHHPVMRVPDVSLDEVVSVIGRYPSTRWIIANCIGSQIRTVCERLSADAQVWFDVARVQGPVDALRTLAAAPGVGVGRLLFGTNMPLLVPESPLMELADARLTSDEERALGRGNALAAFGLDAT